MVKSIVAIEDYRYYQHGALDLKGTLRALITNQANNGRGPGWLVDHPADGQADAAEPGEGQEGARGRDRRHVRPQGARAALRDRLRAAVLQGLDPGALPQPRLLRRRRLRHPVGRPSLLQQERQGPRLARVGRAGRAGQEPDRLRPDQLPRPGPRASRHRARPDGPAQRDHRRQGRPAEGQEPRPARGQHPERLRVLPCAVLLRLRPQPALPRQVAGRHGRGAQGAHQVRRPDHPHHDRPADAGRCRRVGRRPRPTRPTRPSAGWRWSSRAPAT